MNWTEIEPKTVLLRNGLLSLMDQVEQESQPENLPQVTETFRAAQKLLQNQEYDIVVCGEVKRGKSSLLNAIIGQDILPVNTNVATSQVFRITNSTEESYSLVFTDDTRIPITRDELSRYGSQVDADLKGESVFEGRTLAHIQINIPMEFLPQGVSLVDTPGLGALYKSHEIITQEYAAKAAAVIFVFDPERPMVVQEQAFLERIFEVTPHVMFVMTKVDLYNQTHWVSQIQRNVSLLTKAFGEKYGLVPEIFPVSSLLLRKAADEEDTDFREVNLDDSMFPAVKEELQRIIYRTVGLLRTGFALSETEKQTGKVRTVIDESLRNVTAQTLEEREKIKADRETMQSTFEANWGPASTTRANVQQEANDICRGVTSRTQQMFMSGGTICRTYTSMIDGLSSMDEVERFAEMLPENIVNDVSAQWKQIVERAVGDLKTVMYRFNSKMESVVYGNYEYTTDFDFETIQISMPVLHYNIFQSVMQYFMLSHIPVVGFVVALAKAVWDLVRGKNTGEQEAVAKNKQNFRQKLNEILNTMSMKLLQVQEGNRSVVDQVNYEIMTAARKTLQKSFEEQKQQLEKAKRDLEDLSKKSGEEKRIALEMLNKQRDEWNGIATELVGIGKLRQEIEKDVE